MGRRGGYARSAENDALERLRLQPGIPARYVGTCPACGRTWTKHQRIARSTRNLGWVHAYCTNFSPNLETRPAKKQVKAHSKTEPTPD